VSKRRKAAHQARRPGGGTGEAPRPKVRDVFVARPFHGLPDEGDWVALRELVPAATAPVRLNPELTEKYGQRDITVATVLPLAWPSLTKPDGRVFVGLQRRTQSGDVSRDLALALLLALESEPGQAPTVPPLPGPGPRLQDVLAPQPLEVTIRDGFDFWLDEQSADPEVKASLERANASVFPSVKMTAAPSAYWCQFPEKSHVRWVLADDEDAALAALSRLAAAGELALGQQTKFAGMFRAHGLLVPVWDLPQAAPADDWEEPLARFAERYAGALAQTGPLDDAARRARQGLLGRQLTLR
jgi:Family of unknown function (DUF5926)